MRLHSRRELSPLGFESRTAGAGLTPVGEGVPGKKLLVSGNEEFRGDDYQAATIRRTHAGGAIQVATQTFSAHSGQFFAEC